MCQIPGDKMDAAMRCQVDAVNYMFDALFGPMLARADAQSRKIAEAARVCRGAKEEDDDPMSTQP